MQAMYVARRVQRPVTFISSDPASLLGRIKPLAAYLWQSQRLEVVIADPVPVLVWLHVEMRLVYLRF